MVTPKLSLDFLSATLDPRITFARAAATATRVNASGLIESVAADTARFDFNPVTLACKGLLVEETRENQFLRSNEFTTSYWVTQYVAISATANAGVSPDGTNNAFKYIADTTNVNHVQGQTSAVTSGTAYTMSLFAKAAEVTKFQMYMTTGFSAIPIATFDLTLGVVQTQPSGNSSSATIEPFGDGWYRCSITATASSTTTGVFRLLRPLSPITDTTPYAGNNVDGFLAYGAQLEVGAFATSYIPTTTTALTRNADVATITGTNFSDFWQAVKGGALVLATPSTVSGIRPLVQFDDNTADNIIALRGNAADPELQIVDGGTPQAQIDAGTIVANTPYSLTGWWQTNDCKARKDSGAVVTDTTATIPTVTQARIGSDGTNYLNGTIATINYYDSFFGRPIYTRRKNKVFASLL
jgi:hypothetical protein